MKAELTERQEQNIVVKACRALPTLNKIYAIPNGGKRGKGRQLVNEGLLAGMPDLCLPVSRGGYHSLYIEMKVKSGGTVSDDQKIVIESLRAEGNRVEVCRGAEQALDVLFCYISPEERGAKKTPAGGRGFSECKAELRGNTLSHNNKAIFRFPQV